MKMYPISVFLVILLAGNVRAQTAGASGAAAPATPATPGSAAHTAPAAPGTPMPGQGAQTPRQASPQQPALTPTKAVTSSSSNGSVSNSTATDVSASSGQSNVTFAATNQFAISNQFGIDSNQFGINSNGFATNFLGAGVADTNQIGATTNQFGTNGLTPTSLPGMTNRIFATNNLSGSNSAAGLFRDQAITPADQQLLAQLRTSVFGASLSPEQLAAQPVHFILANGVVRLVGDVSSLEQRQQIEAAVQRVGGVVRVYDALNISGQPSLGVNVLPGNTPQNALSPVSTPGTTDNRIYATNAPSTVSTQQNTPSFPGTAPSGSTPGSTPP